MGNKNKCEKENNQKEFEEMKNKISSELSIASEKNKQLVCDNEKIKTEMTQIEEKNNLISKELNEIQEENNKNKCEKENIQKEFEEIKKKMSSELSVSSEKMEKDLCKVKELEDDKCRL